MAVSHPPQLDPASAASDRVHLDAGGNARLRPEAQLALLQALSNGWSDPYRLSTESRQAATMLAASRAAIAEVLGVRTEEVHLAPSHVTALHTGVRAVAHGRRRTGTTIVTSAVERAAVLSATDFLATGPGHPAGGGAEHRTIPVDRLGRVDLPAFIAAVTMPGVGLAALQHSNGEVGTTQPIEAAYAATRAARVPLLVDAGATVGHIPLPNSWDILAANAADWGGPAGIGILVVRAGVRWRRDWPEDADPWFPGGVSVPAAFAAAVALQASIADMRPQDEHRRHLIDLLRERIPVLVPDVEVLGDPEDRLPHILTFSCLFVDGEALVSELDAAGFAVGSGSACTSTALEPSHVLAAMGSLTHGNVRITLDRGTSRDDVDRFLAALPGAVARVRAKLGVGSL